MNNDVNNSDHQIFINPAGGAVTHRITGLDVWTQDYVYSFTQVFIIIVIMLHTRYSPPEPLGVTAERAGITLSIVLLCGLSKGGFKW